jgi:two-component system, cell cycle sensor histidine kinase and response regulator CckA
MKPPLRVLIVEDSEDDMLLILRELRQSGYTLDYQRVDTAVAMHTALEQQSWDIVIADYSLPAFSGPEALKLMQNQGLDLPFIIISGTIGEDTAVDAMKAGAHDFLSKGKLARLVPAVERELREAEERRKRHSAEHALQEANDVLRNYADELEGLYNHAPCGYHSLDKEGILIRINDTELKMLGYARDELVGKKKFSELLTEESLRAFQANFPLLQNQGWVRNLELQMIRKDDSILPVSLSATVVYDKAGNYLLSRSVVIDISDRKRAEEELRDLEVQFLRAQRMESLGTLASGIAHDFNNILTPILAASQLIPLKIPNLDQKNLELLQLIENSTKRGADLVKQILAFARGVEGKRLPLQVRHLLAEVIKVMRQTFPKNITISTDIPTTNLWTVSADATQLHQVLMNLCVNARDAMPDGGKLGLAIANQFIDEAYTRMNLDAHVGSYVVITVADTGTGIPTKVIDRIFDPFFTTKEQGKGTGLGLSTVLGIVKGHGGFVQVYSEIGSGTQFKVYLPAISDADPVHEEEQALLPGQQELILIVDDEPLIRQVAQTVLETHNYKTILASDGIEAIAVYAQHKNEISAVLMDMMMPSMDGMTAIRTLQKLNPKINVIATSGLTSNAQLTVERGMEVKAFLPKPYTANDLLDVLQRVLHMGTSADNS